MEPAAPAVLDVPLDEGRRRDAQVFLIGDGVGVDAEDARDCCTRRSSVGLSVSWAGECVATFVLEGEGETSRIALEGDLFGRDTDVIDECGEPGVGV